MIKCNRAAGTLANATSPCRKAQSSMYGNNFTRALVAACVHARDVTECSRAALFRVKQVRAMCFLPLSDHPTNLYFSLEEKNQRAPS